MISIYSASELSVRQPRLAPPAGTTDCHFHVFGPADRYPMVPERRFTPTDASSEQYLRVCRALGVERAVVVQASGYGFDNSRVVDASRELPIETRLVVVVPPDAPEKEFRRLDDLGARGLRVIATQPGGIRLDDLEHCADRCRDLGWHIQLLVNPQHLIELEARLSRLACPVVIDHIAHVPAEAGIADPAFAVLMRLLDGANCWVKLSAGYHLSSAQPPYDDLLPMAHALCEARPDRLVWGTDWPHVAVKGAMPDAIDLLDLLIEWVPDETIRKRVLVDNPAALYGFGE